jgi:hypothetical protein
MNRRSKRLFDAGALVAVLHLVNRFQEVHLSSAAAFLAGQRRATV